MTLPSFNGLFARVISESTGMGAAPISYAQDNTQDLVHQLHCDNTTKHPEGVLECMKHKPALKILQAVDKSRFDAQMGPFVDGELVPLDPIVLRDAGLINNVSFLAGAQTNDSNRFCVFNDGESGGYQHVNMSAYIHNTNRTIMRRFGADPNGALLKRALELYPPVNFQGDDDDEGPNGRWGWGIMLVWWYRPEAERRERYGHE
jgi:carboxylesterase type B